MLTRTTLDGVTLQETVNVLVEGVAQLVRAERLLEMGVDAVEASRLGS